MANKKIPTLAGMNIAQEEAALEIGGKSPRLYVREAVNLDFTATGRAQLRPGVQRQSNKLLRYMWQSPLHKDCFALLGEDWVKFDPVTFEHELLLKVGDSAITHVLLNNKVCMSCATGLFVYDGATAQPLTIPTPPKPYAKTDDGGSLPGGDYSFSISWLVEGNESGLSEIDKVLVQSNGLVNLQFPLCLSDHVTHVRLYMTESGGSELRQVSEYPIQTINLQVITLPELGRAAQFRYLSPMLHGDFLRLWRGRLLCARSNVLHYSEAMTYHLTDERYNFIQFPQRISFIEPVEGGIWIGQSDHVLFLRGQDMRSLSIEPKASRAPVRGSSQLLHSDVVGGDISQGGAWSAIWLAENGFALGTASGQIIEPNGKTIQGISAKSGSLVGFGDRVLAVVS